MSTRPMECGTCGLDHPSAQPCPKPKKPKKRALKIAIIGRGFAGWHAAGVENGAQVSISGAELLDTPWVHGGVKRGLLQDARDGTPVYDAAHLAGVPDGRAFVAWVCSTSRGGYTPEEAAEVIAELRAKVLGVRIGVVRGGGKNKHVKWAGPAHAQLRYLPFICERFPDPKRGRVEELFPTRAAALARFHEIEADVEDACLYFEAENYYPAGVCETLK